MRTKISIISTALILMALYCIPQLGYAQLPDNVDTSDCVSTPPAHAFDIQKKWETPDPGPGGDYAHSASTPLVADMDGDGFPEVLCPWYTYHDHIYGGSNASSRTRPNNWLTTHICVYDGRTGSFKYKIQTPYYNVDAQPIALADVDKDGRTEVFLIDVDKYVYCYRYNANSSASDYKWKSEQPVDEHYILMIADVNNDGFAEVVCGPSIFNAITGKLLLKGQMENTGKGFFSPTNANLDAQYATTWRGYPSHIFALADMDNDKTLELCAGNTIYKMNITNPLNSTGNSWSILRQAESRSDIKEWDGTTIVFDFDNDGDLDVAVLGQNTTATSTSARWNRRYDIYVWDGQTNKVIANTSFEKRLAVSIPFAGDINGDGKAELIFNCNLNGNYQTPDMMRVYAYDPSSQGNMKLLFSQDEAKEFAESSGFTVFDFNQDGAAEIIYRGEKFLYILDGTTLNKLSDPITTRSNTASEYPIVADVDCDGHADILFTERFVWDFTGEYAQSQPARGKVMCYESKTPGAWAPARKVWNQTPYYVVNINEDMTVPQYQFNIATQFPNGKRPFNSFLQQATTLNSDGDMFAPAADMEALPDENTFQNLCDKFVIKLKYTNRGSQMLNAPYYVTVFKNSDRGQVIRSAEKNQNLMVGDTTTITFTFTDTEINSYMPMESIVVVVNNAGTGTAQNGGQQQECNVKNNYASSPFDEVLSSEEIEQNITICEGEELVVGEHSYTKSGNYIDTLKNKNGCDSIVKTHLTVSSISVDLGPDQRYCERALLGEPGYEPVTLDGGASAASYLWDDGSTERYRTTPSGLSAGNHEYYVTVTNRDGCTASDTVIITVIHNPEITITKNPDYPDYCKDGQVTLIASADVDGVIWQWASGQTTADITVTTEEVGPGMRVYVVGSNDGCKNSQTDTIAPCPCSVELFNAFTPNGDGINDAFAPKIDADFKYYQLVIYDRWGKSVYKSEDPEEAWDGTINGHAKAADGVYYYVFTYACMSAPDEKISKHGSITLIR